MGVRQNRVGWLGLVAGVLWATAAVRGGDPGRGGLEGRTPGADLPLERLPPAMRGAVRRVVDRPTLYVQGPDEVFRGQPALYRWLLAHPDQGVQLWRSLGARCMEVTNLGGGRFGWSDGQGTQFRWEGIHEDSQCRVWYAEGSSHPTFLLPTISARAVVILHYAELYDDAGRSLIQQQAELFLQLDSRAAALLTRLLGPSAPRLAEQGLAQMQMFYSALVWYFDRHPDQAAALLGRLGAVPAEK